LKPQLKLLIVKCGKVIAEPKELIRITKQKKEGIACE